MSSIGHPLLGDDVYGSGKSPFNLTGQTLHAGVLGFIHPSTKEYVEYSAPLPEYFRRCLISCVVIVELSCADGQIIC